MSNWTHVAGIVRLNGYDFENFTEKEYDSFVQKYWEKYPKREERVRALIYDTFGRPVGFHDDIKDIPKPHLPMGSEGSLNIIIKVRPEEYMEMAIVMIYGDLRDHYSANEIIKWFKKVLSKWWVRQATITVENENNGTVNWTYGEEEE